MLDKDLLELLALFRSNDVEFLEFPRPVANRFRCG